MRLFPLNEPNVLDDEKRFIMATLGGHLPEAISNLNWKKVTEMAYQEGVQGILYRHLKDRDILRPALSLLKDYYLSTAAQNLFNLNALERLEDTLGTEKIEVMTLKGASLLNSVYPVVEMRPMGDLDLMVRPKERERFVNLLYRLGYKKHPLLSNFFKKNRVVIDLHIHALNTDRIANRAGLFPSGMEPVWAKSEPWTEGYQWLRRPNDIDNLLLLSQHLMKHSFSRLIWLVDIYELLRGRDNKFWIKLSKRADQLFQRKPLSYTLYLLKELFDYSPPQGSGFKNLSEELNRVERGILGARIRGPSFDHMGPLLSLLCIPGYKQRIAFAWETLFPKKKVVEQEFCRPVGGKRLFFYPVRLLQALALASRHISLIFGALIRGA